MDFSIEYYITLLNFLIDSGYTPITVQKYILERNSLLNSPFVILRHDIDRRVHKARIFADVEKKIGISSSYYFRYGALSNPEIIKYIADQGHEVGYHYEVMSRANGNIKEAREIFEHDLKKLRDIAQINTACMHGSPLSPYNNLSFWDYNRPEEFDLLGEAFLSLSNMEYFSDTGRTWSQDHKIRDRLPGDNKREKSGDIHQTKDLIDYIKNIHPSNLYIVTHPERWAETYPEWIYILLKDYGFNIGKMTISSIRV